MSGGLDKEQRDRLGGKVPPTVASFQSSRPCRACGKMITFIKSPAGHPQAVDVARVQVILDDGTSVYGRTSHWATCPHADQMRAEKAAKAREGERVAPRKEDAAPPAPASTGQLALPGSDGDPRVVVGQRLAKATVLGAFHEATKAAVMEAVRQFPGDLEIVVAPNADMQRESERLRGLRTLKAGELRVFNVVSETPIGEVGVDGCQRPGVRVVFRLTPKIVETFLPPSAFRAREG